MRQIGVAISVLFLLSLTQFFLSGSSVAADTGPALAVLADNGPQLSEAESGWVVELSATNLTQGELRLAAAPTTGAPAGCTATPKPATIPAAANTKFEVGIAASCAVSDGFNFTLTVSLADGPSQPLSVNATKPAEETQDWGSLIVFVVFLGILGFVGLIASIVISIAKKTTGWFGNLLYLDSSWSFSDSWLTNITAGAGLLTGVVGSSDVVKALLGVDDDSDLRLATVGAAISLALLAAAPLILGIVQSKTGAITIVGLFLAAAVSLAAALSEVWIMGRTAKNLDIIWLANHGMTLAWVAIVLVLVYGCVALWGTVSSGLTPPAVTESDAVTAAKLVSAAIEHARQEASKPGAAVPSPEGQAQLNQVLDAVKGHTNDAINNSMHPVIRRRSALL